MRELAAYAIPIPRVDMHHQSLHTEFEVHWTILSHEHRWQNLLEHPSREDGITLSNLNSTFTEGRGSLHA